MFMCQSGYSSTVTFGLRRKTLEKLTAAFELALSKLRLSDHRDPLAVVLAKFIIELAKEGERDPDALCEGALRLLRK
jgi:hypothetical protein